MEQRGRRATVKGEKKKPPRGHKGSVAELNSRLGLWESAVICLTALAVSLHTIAFNFVWDDEFQVLRNPWIRDWSRVLQFFTTDVWAFSSTQPKTSFYRPLHMVAHALGYSFSGFHPQGYHLMNIVLHAISAWLAARIALQLTQDRSIALVAGLLFAVHPIHAESVTWIAAITDPLCAVFYFWALLLYLRYSASPEKWREFAIVLALFFLALLAKEMAFAFPLIVIWADWSLERKLYWRRYALLLGVFALYSVLRIFALGLRHFASHMSVKERSLSVLVLLASDIAKLFVPYGINPYHLFHPTRSLLDVRFPLSVAALALFGLLGWWRKQPAVLFLTGFAALSLLPTLALVDNLDTVFADRYLYIPSLAACILIPVLAQSAIQSVLRKWPQPHSLLARCPLYCVCAPLVVVYAALLIHTSYFWQDDVSLYSSSPESRPFVDGLASYYYKKGDYEKAEPLFQRLIDLSQNSNLENKQFLAEGYTGLGSIQYSQGRYADARLNLDRAFALNPSDPAMLQNLGSISLMLGDYPSTVAYYKQALAENPRNDLIYYNLSSMYLTIRQNEAAIENARKALEIDPHLSQAYIVMGHAYANMGMKENAIEAFDQAQNIDPEKKATVEAALRQHYK
jgi:tetratricopeptide (TPR) repeat protein